MGLIIGQLTTGGAEGQLRLLCEGFDSARVRATVYCLSPEVEPYGPRLEAAGIPVRVIGGSRLGRLRRLRRQLRADRIRVAHAWLFIANAYAWAASRAAPWALVTSARNCKRSSRLLDALNRRAFRASDAIIVNSTEVHQYVQREYGAPADRLALIRNAIDLKRFQPRAVPRAEGPTVVMVGRLVTQKNPLLFVAAAAALVERVPTARFLLVGDGPLRGQVETAIRAAQLSDRCILLGERGDVETVLSDADLFWLTSDWEGLPNAVIEALASGLPVVATDVGGTAELVRAGVEGFVVPPGDRVALVERSAEILLDPALQARMRSAARARAEAYGIGPMVEATSAVYARALERRGA